MNNEEKRKLRFNLDQLNSDLHLVIKDIKELIKTSTDFNDCMSNAEYYQVMRDLLEILKFAEKASQSCANIGNFFRPILLGEEFREPFKDYSLLANTRFWNDEFQEEANLRWLHEELNRCRN